jgi:transcriptional regulator with XRE-family HTH domain
VIWYHITVDGKAEASAILRRLRRDNGLTQRDLAAKAGVPQSTIAEVEAGQREPSLTLLSRIAESAGQSIAIRLVPLLRHSAVATANTIKDRLSGDAGEGLSLDIREDGALRAVIDLKDALRRSNNEGFDALTTQAPSLVGDSRWDAFIAAIVEDEAARKVISPPRWTNEQKRFNRPFWYLSKNPRFHTWEIANSPGALIRHGVFAAEEELESV